jgi:[glutamine synthetase] adenylyltransferase / [glutamine synthetase]-adenylyl-L-tyrosine phosphorylase
MQNLNSLIEDLPDAESARRFLDQFGEKNPSQNIKLLKNEGLLSDLLTLVSFSPLLATTVLQNPNYLWWLNRHRSESKIRDKEELLESLGRFSLMNSTIEPQVLLARFRRRELLRIFLHDIRRLATISEITEEISNLADAILEYALRFAKQELDNRFGIPLETDEKGRARPADFCVVSLGKLGSKELNYSSDIDLLFLYSADGKTSGKGTRGETTNREYFVKLAELVTRIVGEQTGEGAAYRVDLRLRPHGRVGALALSVKETIRYYQTEARNWERQVLIRSRASAGGAELFKKFFAKVEDFVFSKNETVENALENVRRSKDKINLEKSSDKGFDVKLGTGGIREIEFIAQALQLAYGGHDEWLRSAHTLITLTRLADRNLFAESELSDLFDAYEFLRRLEHLLQMENGLQTHLVPEDTGRRAVFARRMNCENLRRFNKALARHTANVNRIFKRIFLTPGGVDAKAGREIQEVSKAVEFPVEKKAAESEISNFKLPNRNEPRAAIRPILSSLEKSDLKIDLGEKTLEILEKLVRISPPFADLVAANPVLIADLPVAENDGGEKNYAEILLLKIGEEKDFARRLAVLRQNWAHFLLEIAVLDVFEKITRQKAKERQTKLAEASLEAAIFITKAELERRYSIAIDDFGFAVLGLGKLGGRGMDYGSDLDLVLIFDDEKVWKKENLSHPEFYARAVEIFVTTLSAMTREGSLYRVDLRLRPDGKNGATSLGKTTFLDYLKNRSAIWEWLAYVKLRIAAGDFGLGEYVEAEARRIIHEKARNAERDELKKETWRVRARLEEEKSASKRGREVDIKFGAGGMLDVYFAMRFLQLQDDVPDSAENRSTDFMLARLFEKRSLGQEDFENLSGGYDFLSELDHHLRLTVGRSTRLPVANQNALQIICERMKIASVGDFLEKLTFHRLNIRASFENILK